MSTIDTSEIEADTSIKYLRDGRAVHVMEQITSGFVVCSIIEDEETGAQWDDERPFVVPQVFDSAPTEKLDEHVLKLREEIQKLSAERAELSNLKRETSQALAAAKERCKIIPALTQLFDFIDKKVTHYVLVSYSGVRIEEFGKLDEIERRDRDAGAKLLVLYGKSNGDLSWRLNHYSDGSGIGTDCFPCTSYEQAKERAREELLKAYQGQYAQCAIESADKLGVEVPAEVRAKSNAKKSENLLSVIAAKENEIAVYRAQLEALK